MLRSAKTFPERSSLKCNVYHQCCTLYLGQNLSKLLFHRAMTIEFHIQFKAKQTAPLLNKHYQNEVTLTGQNPPLKCCQPLESLAHLITDLDLSMIEIWGL